MEQTDRYKIIREIGAGGMAQVFLAQDTRLNREVALKKVHKHLKNQSHTIKRFEKEAQVIAKLSHPNIIKLFDYGIDEDDSQYLVMEYIEGKTLTEIIAENRPFSNTVLLSLMSQILAGLSAAHAKGIYHRDIKPANIMVDSLGVVKIMDFGVAYLVDQDSLTMTGTFVGSPNYISPEQARGDQLTEKTDVFSVGTLMYEYATGICPFTGENVHAAILSIIESDPVSIQNFKAKIATEVEKLILRCLTKVVEDRPTANEMLVEIESFCDMLGLITNDKALGSYFLNGMEY